MKLLLALMFCSLLWPTVQAASQKECQIWVNDLTVESRNFLECMKTPHEILCHTCSDHFNRSQMAFQKLWSDKVCWLTTFAPGRFHKFFEILDEVNHIWEESRCIKCPLQWQEIALKLNALKHCTQRNFNNICRRCTGQFYKLIDKLDQMYIDNYGNMCPDLSWQMNYTRNHWMKWFRCQRPGVLVVTRWRLINGVIRPYYEGLYDEEDNNEKYMTLSYGPSLMS